MTSRLIAKHGDMIGEFMTTPMQSPQAGPAWPGYRNATKMPPAYFPGFGGSAAQNMMAMST